METKRVEKIWIVKYLGQVDLEAYGANLHLPGI
jgi:hypothetical protein